MKAPTQAPTPCLWTGFLTGHPRTNLLGAFQQSLASYNRKNGRFKTLNHNYVNVKLVRYVGMTTFQHNVPIYNFKFSKYFWAQALFQQILFVKLLLLLSPLEFVFVIWLHREKKIEAFRTIQSLAQHHPEVLKTSLQRVCLAIIGEVSVHTFLQPLLQFSLSMMKDVMML